MAPVEARLRELLPDDRRVALLENTRFHPGETANDPAFARELAAGMDLYVNDAFGSAHRAHASTEGVARLLPAYAGLLLERELGSSGGSSRSPSGPYVAIVGGAKVEDKIGVLRRLAELADSLLVGGKMAEELRAGATCATCRRRDVELPVGRRRRGRVRARGRVDGRRGRRAPGGLARARHRPGDAARFARA